jgi:hypothetical protein
MRKGISADLHHGLLCYRRFCDLIKDLWRLCGFPGSTNELPIKTQSIVGFIFPACCLRPLFFNQAADGQNNANNFLIFGNIFEVYPTNSRVCFCQVDAARSKNQRKFQTLAVNRSESQSCAHSLSKLICVISSAAVVYAICVDMKRPFY